jgi:putative ABC transport system permease protein
MSLWTDAPMNFPSWNLDAGSVLHKVITPSSSSVLPWRVVIHHLTRERVRLTMTVLGVAFAVFLMVFQGSLLVGFIVASQQVIRVAGGDLWILPRGVTCFDFASTLPRRFGDLARGVSGVIDARPMVTAFTTMQREDGHRRAVLVVGAEPVGEWPTAAMPDGRLPDRAVVDGSAANLLGVISVPSTIEVGGHRAVVTGLASQFGGFLGSPYVFTGVAEARRWTRTSEDSVSYWVISLGHGTPVEEAAATLRARMPDADVLTANEFARQSAMFWLIQTGAGGAILTAGILGFLVGLAIV